MYKGTLLYSSSKYLELIITALILLHFAKEVGPLKFGESAASFLVISYSAFIILGINGSYVKYVSIEKDSKNRRYLSSYNFGYNFAAACLAVLVTLFVIRQDYALTVAAIAGLSLIRGSIQSILRGYLYTGPLALINLLFALLFLAGYMSAFIFREEMSGPIFFGCWAASLLATSIAGSYILYRYKCLSSFFQPAFIEHCAVNFKKLAVNGLLLALMTFASVVFISFDRISLILAGVDKELIGIYQFADSLSSIFYRGCNTLIFMLTPIYIAKLTSGNIGFGQFFSVGEKIALAAIPVFVIFIFVADFGTAYFAADYTGITFIIALLSSVKFVLLMLFLPTTVYKALNKEASLLLMYVGSAFSCMLLQLYISFYAEESALYALPLVSFLSLLALYLYSKKKVFEKLQY